MCRVKLWGIAQMNQSIISKILVYFFSVQIGTQPFKTRKKKL